MSSLLALIGFSFVSSVTPGPNNVLLWASGATFGFRRTIPHIVGTALGIGAMALAVVVGIGGLLEVLPGLAVAMKVAGSLYLLFLAWQVAGSGALRSGSIAKPMGLFQAATFQVLNVKAWTFAIGAVTTFRPAELSSFSGGALVALVMMVVIVPTAALWAAAGGAIGRWLSDDRSRRLLSGIMAGLLAVTVVTVWL